MGWWPCPERHRLRPSRTTHAGLQISATGTQVSLKNVQTAVAEASVCFVARGPALAQREFCEEVFGGRVGGETFAFALQPLAVDPSTYMAQRIPAATSSTSMKTASSEAMPWRRSRRC